MLPFKVYTPTSSTASAPAVVAHGGTPPARKLFIFKARKPKGQGLKTEFHCINTPGLPIAEVPGFATKKWFGPAGILDLPVAIHQALATTVDKLNNGVVDYPGWVFVAAGEYPGTGNGTHYAAIFEKSGAPIDATTSTSAGKTTIALVPDEEKTEVPGSWETPAPSVTIKAAKVPSWVGATFGNTTDHVTTMHGKATGTDGWGVGTESHGNTASTGGWANAFENDGVNYGFKRHGEEADDDGWGFTFEDDNIDDGTKHHQKASSIDSWRTHTNTCKCDNWNDQVGGSDTGSTFTEHMGFSSQDYLALSPLSRARIVEEKVHKLKTEKTKKPVAEGPQFCKIMEKKHRR